MIKLALMSQLMVALAWDYPVTNQTDDMVFKLYSSTNASIPISQWQVIGTLPATMRECRVLTTPGPRFFQITASNRFGESVFATVTNRWY